MRSGQNSASTETTPSDVVVVQERLRALGTHSSPIDAEFAARALVVAFHKQALLRLMRRCASAMQALAHRPLPVPRAFRKPGA